MAANFGLILASGDANEVNMKRIIIVLLLGFLSLSAGAQGRGHHRHGNKNGHHWKQQGRPGNGNGYAWGRHYKTNRYRQYYRGGSQYGYNNRSHFRHPDANHYRYQQGYNRQYNRQSAYYRNYNRR